LVLLLLGQSSQTPPPPFSIVLPTAAAAPTWDRGYQDWMDRYPGSYVGSDSSSSGGFNGLDANETHTAHSLEQCRRAANGQYRDLGGENSRTFLNKDVVVKLIYLDERKTEKLPDEARNLKMCIGINGLVQLLGAEICSCGAQCLTLQKAPGEALVHNQFVGDPRGAAIVIQSTANVLLRLFEKCQLIHGDLKPGNVCYDPETNTITILDLGSAINRMSWLRRVHTDNMVAPPESFQGSKFKYDVNFADRIDSWCIGLLFLALVIPDLLPTRKGDISRMRDAQEYLNALGYPIIAQCLEEDPCRRPTMSGITQAL
jgi:serine/threonine protein kinase